MMRDNEIRHLYVHVPFCRTICFYCDFCRTVYLEQIASQWLDALEKELLLKDIRIPQKTIYIGGGTPTCLTPNQLDRLLGMLDVHRGEDCEYTIEVNPETMTDEKADILAEHGITRASIGYQTSDEQMLKTMNRHHTAEDVRRKMDLLRSRGITNLSLDIMYSLPEQTMGDLQKSVMDALAMEPSHLSLYSLTIEEHTVFAKKGFRPCDDELEADMYEWIVQTLESHGYEQYEISNFASKGMYSRHNTAYWEYRNFHGISMGASGKESGFRYDNTKNLNEYLTDPLKREIIELSEADEMFEMVMMGLRMKHGMSLKRFEECFGRTLLSVYEKQLDRLKKQGMLLLQDDRVCCTPKGYEILNTVLEEFLD